MYFYSDNSSDLGRGINPPLVCPGVSDLMSNFITARSTSPLSDPSGREARVTSAFESPLSDLNGREASLIAESKNPLSVKHISHCREVSVMAATQCFQININMSKSEITTKDENKNKNHVKIKKDSVGITKIIKKK